MDSLHGGGGGGGGGGAGQEAACPVKSISEATFIFLTSASGNTILSLNSAVC